MPLYLAVYGGGRRAGGRGLALLLLLAACGPPSARALGENETTVRVSAVSADGSAAGGEALAQLAAAALRARGVRAAAVRAPACGARCGEWALRALAGGAVHAALLPVRAAAAPPAPRLRDAGLEELGDAAPPSRRACLARGPLRSLLDLADPARAAAVALHMDDLFSTSGWSCDASECVNRTFTPQVCENVTCATIVTSDEYELNVIADVVKEQSLYANVVALGSHLFDFANASADNAIIVCDHAPDLNELAYLRTQPLGPPPCRRDHACPFEPRRLVKLANARSLARSPTALNVLARLYLSADEMRELVIDAHLHGPEAAAERYTQRHPPDAPYGEVRTAVLVPADSPREAYGARALAAAAALAEEDLARRRLPRAAHFKVELTDAGCAAPRAYKYLTDALGTGEYGALAAVAGPACGAAFADVARLAPAHALPVLAYTVQAAPRAPALLAAGEARAPAAALAALLAAHGWRRLAALSEPATRASLDHPSLRAALVVHTELPDSGPQLHDQLIVQWAQRVAAANGRIVYVSVEDARTVRAALCAALAAGLSPAAGVVWLLPATLPAGWLRPAPADAPACDAARLQRAADGHLSVAPEWLVDWQEDTLRATPWRTRWAARCRARASSSPPAAAASPDCAHAPAHAALLYDVLTLWAIALDHLLAVFPAALDDLHRPELIQMLIENATSTKFTGLTGPFEWTRAEGAHARNSALVVRQWRNGSAVRVARWAGGRLQPLAALRWRTADGRPPDDGAERCALRPLAELLRADCRAAYAALGALLLAVLVAALAAVAAHCKRRADRERRARLAALDMRAFGLKPGGLDRWELPRERVVINRKLGTGAFGTVYGGHALLSQERGWTAVAVKTLKAGASTEEKLDFLSEAEAMKRFEHKNIVRLLGVVTKTQPVCTVMEFMLYGDLKNYLLARRHLASAADAEEVSARQLTRLALDAARALSYLAQQRYVHRDVAARNCLISAQRVLKLADFGMTRLVFENDYYRFSRKGLLPVRWMAPESLTLGVFSPASDVWSFGVLLYEIVTFGSLPFQGLSNSEVLARVKAGHTLELPQGLKPQLVGLIKSCWLQDHKARPGAAEVAAFLADSPRLLAPCLDVPLDALPLDLDRAEARWVSWAAPPSAATDTTYLSADVPPPSDTDAFLPAV